MKNPIEMTDLELLDNLQELSVKRNQLLQAKDRPVPGVSFEFFAEIEKAISACQTAIDLIRAEIFRRMRKEEFPSMGTKQIPIEIEVVNTYRLDDKRVGEYIDNGSPLGNPFAHEGIEGIEKYRIWLREQLENSNQEVIKELNRLVYKALYEGGLKLRCYCTNPLCHGDVIKEYLERFIQRFYKEELRG